MRAGVYHLYIQQGETYSRTITILGANSTPWDLTGYTARGKIKANAQSSDVVASFTCTIDANPATGKLAISLSDTITSGIPADGSSYKEVTKYVYDVELVSGSGSVYRVLNGIAQVSPEITK